MSRALTSPLLQQRGQRDAQPGRARLAESNGLAASSAPWSRRSCGLDERLSRVEKRLDDAVPHQPDYATRTELQDPRSSVEELQARIAALERRADQS